MKEILVAPGKVALVDDEDWDLVRKFEWVVRSTPWTDYAVTSRRASGARLRFCESCGRILHKNPDTGRWPRLCKKCRRVPRRKRDDKAGYSPWGQVVPMQWMILKPSSGNHVHHLNGNGLDNRRVNLMSISAHEHKQLHRASRRGEEVYEYLPTPLGIERHGFPAPVVKPPAAFSEQKREPTWNSGFVMMLVILALLVVLVGLLLYACGVVLGY